MRKPRDYDAELKALNDKARQLKERRLIQLGELVIATGADTLAIDLLAGALLNAAETKDAGVVEGWRKHGAAFFQRTARKPQGSNDRSVGSERANISATKPSPGDTSAA